VHSEELEEVSHEQLEEAPFENEKDPMADNSPLKLLLP
jgi:hypothetical protein